EESGAISKATQAKPAVVSRKSQAKLGVCLKCVNKKAQIRALQKQNVRLRSQREKWKKAARGVPLSPLVLGRYPAGNILLRFAILMAGASVSKVLLVLKHLGICIYCARTYFALRSKFLFPAILTHCE
ncbi:unnamed protein product, partial [Porites evermanni]